MQYLKPNTVPKSIPLPLILFWALFQLFMIILAKNLCTGLVFLNLRKAFDCVPHDILFAKLKHCGIRGPANRLIETFLKRSQFTIANSIDSKIKSVKYGLAQGSTLGPLQFLLYINDLPNSTCSLPTLFADGTCLILSSNTIPRFEAKMNLDLQKFHTGGWLME